MRMGLGVLDIPEDSCHGSELDGISALSTLLSSSSLPSSSSMRCSIMFTDSSSVSTWSVGYAICDQKGPCKPAVYFLAHLVFASKIQLTTGVFWTSIE